jgi:hypothetical protein
MADKKSTSRTWIEERGYPGPAVPSSSLPPPPVKPQAPRPNGARSAPSPDRFAERSDR